MGNGFVNDQIAAGAKPSFSTSPSNEKLNLSGVAALPTNDVVPAPASAPGPDGGQAEVIPGEKSKPVKGKPLTTALSSGMFHDRMTAADAVKTYKEEMISGQNLSSKQGTFMGVIAPCMGNIVGSLLFLRLPFIVGKTGVIEGLVLVSVCCLTTFITILSLSAVSTNGRVTEGGSYFLISRSLGPSLGAGVGVCFFAANSFAAALYIMATVEAIVDATPSNQQIWPLPPRNDPNYLYDFRMNVRLTGWLILALGSITVGIGLKHIEKIGVLFLVIVFIVLMSMYIGLIVGPIEGINNILGPNNDIEWNRHQLNANLYANYNEPGDAFFDDTASWSFWSCLALFFPACTGIMAGSNRSANLLNPSKSIPSGTIFAHVTTSLIYISFVLLFGWGIQRKLLLDDEVISASVAWPSRYVVIFGVVFTSLGAMLQSLATASHILNAISQDHTLPILDYVRSAHGKEPVKAVILSGCVSFFVVAVGDMNQIAPIMTMLFLMCYFCVNMSCAMLDVINDPNWRPTFKFHHVTVSIGGMALCLALMFFIHPLLAGISLLFCVVVFFYACSNSNQVNWGDGFRGMFFQIAKTLLRDVDGGDTHTKNWRPQILVLTGLTVQSDRKGIQLHDMELVHLASQLKAGKGLTIVGGVIHVPDLGRGSFLSKMSANKIRDWSQVVHSNLQDLGIAGFAKCVYAAQLGEGIMSLIQTAGLGAFQPNCVMVSWPFSWVVVPEARIRFIQAVQVCSIFEKVIIVAKEGHSFPLNKTKLKKGYIDCWWVVQDGGIILLLSFLLNKNEVWKGSEIRLFAIIDSQNDDAGEVKKELMSYITDHRLPITVRTVGMETSVVFSEHRFGDLNRRMKSRQTRFASSVKIPTKDNPLDDIFRNAARVRGRDGGRASFAYRNSLQDQTNILRNAFTDPGPGPVFDRRQKMSDLSFNPSDGVQGTPLVLGTPLETIPDSRPVVTQDNPLVDSGVARSGLSMSGGAGQYSPHFSGRDSNFSSHNDDMDDIMSQATSPTARKSNWVSSFAMEENRLKSNTPCSDANLNCAKVLNAAMKKQSANSNLVITNLPDVPENESAFGYMQFIEHLTAELPRCLLIRGNAGEMITAFT